MRFIESILLKDGQYINLDLHQQRIDEVFKVHASMDLAHNLKNVLPNIQLEGIYKVRMVYDLDSEDAEYDIEYAVYHPRKIEKLEVMPSNPFDYAFKYEDRNHINRLVSQSGADDILIAIYNQITDGSYFNVAFWDGTNWYTPSTYLLNGVRRQQLLSDKKIIETKISVEDIKHYQKVSLINAMMDLGEIELPISAIDTPRSDD
ncbi:aminotransferase class IV [Ekhidna sp.]|uniref:aminotransferase class IV n=1 Tax=Ekhidna sp. TaxID=2608089 RepID=UPI003B503CB4